MAQWKPSVGDKFVYYETWEDGSYWHGAPYSVTSGNDTLTMKILNTDSAYSDSFQHVVTVQNSSAQRKIINKSLYYYHPGKNLSSAHPFAIDIGYTLCSSCVISYDFSIAVDTQVTYGASPLKVFAFEHDSEINGNPNAYRNAAAQFSKAFKWLYSTNSSDYEPGQDPYYNGSFGSITLISAITVLSAVEQQPAHGYAPMTITQSANYLTITSFDTGGRVFTISLLDPLARAIRSWQIPAGTGAERITLNIADVPSGIYFLKLEGQGIGEVKKLALLR